MALQLLVMLQDPTVPQEFVTYARPIVENIIVEAQAKVNESNQPVFGSTPVQVETTTIAVPTASVDIKVNGSDGPLVLTPTSCIISGVPTCANVKVSWSSYGVSNCGITGTKLWNGNYGTNSEREDIVNATSTIKIQCGSLSDSVEVSL